MKFKASNSVFIVLFVLIVLSGGIYFTFRWIGYQLGPSYTGEVEFIIESQSTLSHISNIIQEKGYVRNARLFSLYLRYKEADRQIKAGEYHIESYTSLDNLIQILMQGQERSFDFTIPEGYNMLQIARKLSQEGLVDESEFIALAKHPPSEICQDLLSDFPAETSLEGFLFPETYRITQPDARKVIDMMTRQFRKVFTFDLEERAMELGFTPFEIIVLASIIEKEAQYADEFPLVSSVFHNRLKDGWKLEACSTVEYVIEKESYVLSLEELKIDSPYNTYLYSGLPKGPIANPGQRAIIAALYPESSPYYFFVARGDGTHAFSKTLSEHLRNVQRYLP